MAYHPNEISSETFLKTLSRYQDHVDSKLEALDEQRYNTISQSIRSRLSPSLEKAELCTLVTWKMKHGTWRPNLAKLAESNDENTISIQSELAMSHVADEKPNGAAIKSALKALTELRGVGPATASLVLSCYRPDSVPFFSDELFRWLHWDDQRKGKGTGWKAQIAYTVGEYVSLVEKAQALCARLNEETAHDSLFMLELEKVAYVIGHEQIDVTQNTAQDLDPEDTKTEKGESRAVGHAESRELPGDDLAEFAESSPKDAGKKRNREYDADDTPSSNRRSGRVKRKQV